jgi:hypothetical protein
VVRSVHGRRRTLTNIVHVDVNLSASDSLRPRLSTSSRLAAYSRCTIGTEHRAYYYACACGHNLLRRRRGVAAASPFCPAWQS